MSASKLSVRLEESVKDIMNKLLESDSVQKVMIPGQLNDRNKAICHLAQKEGQNFVAPFVYVFRKGIALSDSTEEKEFFKKSIDVWNSDFRTTFYKNFEQTLGPIPDHILAKPQPKSIQEYGEHLTREADSGSVLRLLAALLPGYMSLCAMYDYVKSQPNFKPNVIVDVLTLHSLGTHEGKAFVKALIDKRSPVNEKEEKEVFDAFRTSWQFEYKFHTYQGWSNAMLAE